MGRRINENYINRYNTIILTQPLAHDTVLQQVYKKANNGWVLTYKTTSIHHICPFDGVFRDCKECGVLEDDFDFQYCVDKTQMISSGALIGRIVDCFKAKLKVEFLNLEEFDG